MALEYAPLHEWDVTPRDAVAIQKAMRERLVLRPPPGLAPRHVAGADMSIELYGTRGYAGVVVLDAGTLETLEECGAAVDVRFPYVPGLLSFRELPAIAAAWTQLERRPDVLIFDGAGYDHPRRFGLACHGGVLFGVPSIGCAKSLLVGGHAPLGEERGATAPVVHRGERVGTAVRTRAGVRPVYVAPGHLMDFETAVAVVLRATSGYREPETTRRSHRLVNRLRREDGEPGTRDGGTEGRPPRAGLEATGRSRRPSVPPTLRPSPEGGTDHA